MVDGARGVSGNPCWISFIETYFIASAAAYGRLAITSIRPYHTNQILGRNL